MVVGEPTLMGGEFGDEDERLITRLENSQFEPGSADDPDHPPQPTNPVATASDGNQPQFQNSPSLNSPWASDKKTPGPNEGPPQPPPPEIKQEN